MVLLAALLAYPVSFGFACRFAGQWPLSESAFTMVYRPCIYLAFHGPPPVRDPLQWWARKCGGELNLLIIEVSRDLSPAVRVEKFR